MKHLIKTQSSNKVETQCGLTLDKIHGTIWFVDNECEACADRTPKPKEIKWTASGRSLAEAMSGFFGSS